MTGYSGKARTKAAQPREPALCQSYRHTIVPHCYSYCTNRSATELHMTVVGAVKTASVVWCHREKDEVPAETVSISLLTYLSLTLLQGSKVCQYNLHSAGSLGWSFPMPKYAYVLLFFKWNTQKQFYQTALGKCYVSKSPTCWLQFEKKISSCRLL